MKTGLGCLGILVGILLCGIGCYVHYTTVVDVPAAAMTMRLQWSGWLWGLIGLVLLLGGWKLLPEK